LSNHHEQTSRSSAFLRRLLLIEFWLAGAVTSYLFWVGYAREGAIGEDAHAYWLTAHTDHLYGAPPGAMDAFLYSPAFAQVIRPLTTLPFAWFCVIVIAVDVAAFIWLMWPLGWRWWVPLLGFLAPELVLGQVTGLLTVAAVLAVTGRAGWWAAGWLTKVTPGVLGATWCVGRRDWRGLGMSLAWSGAIAALSFVVWPRAWFDWVGFLRSSPGSPRLAVLTAAALGLALLGARRGWLWVIPVGLLLSAPTPVLAVRGVVPHLAFLCGLVRLRNGASVGRPVEERVGELARD
jgi:hypothetical protein